MALDRLSLPPRAEYAAACRTGLAGPFGVAPSSDDPAGWDRGAGYPPSYRGFGRLRSLLALRATRRLKPRRVLEVAAGDGRLAASLVASGAEVVLNDLRADVLGASVERYGVAGRVTLAPGDFFQLSASALGTFDLVLAREVIEHVAHPDQLLRHLSTLLAPGGRLYLTTPNGSHFRNRLPTFSQVGDPSTLEARQFQPDADGHLFLLTPREVRDLAGAAGLEVVALGAFGGPFVSGHGGLARLASARLVNLAWLMERLLQAAPACLRARLGAGLEVVLAPRKA